MHADCFANWEQCILAGLRACGRERERDFAGDHQSSPDLWKLRGYELVFRVTACICGQGHLRKDVNYAIPTNQRVFTGCGSDMNLVSGNQWTVPGPRNNIGTVQGVDNGLKRNLLAKPRNPQLMKSFKEVKQLNAGALASAREIKTQSYIKCQPLHNSAIYGGVTNDLRIRTFSFSSTGSSTASSGAHSPLLLTPPREECAGERVCGIYTPPPLHPPPNWSPGAATTAPLQLGNMFRHRSDLSVFRKLPRAAQNMYHIRVEDEGPHGNDQIRSFLLKSLTRNKV